MRTRRSHRPQITSTQLERNSLYFDRGEIRFYKAEAAHIRGSAAVRRPQAEPQVLHLIEMNRRIVAHHIEPEPVD
jgi:hypothetical protein